MAICSNCNSEGGNGAFCANCGAKLGGGNAPVSQGTTIQINNLRDNANILCTEKVGCFEVFEYQKDLSVSPANAITAYFMNEMNYRRRQVLCNLNGNSVKLQAGAMQWMAGNVSMSSDIHGAKDFLGKTLKSFGSGESISKPLYSGNGYVMLEPTFRYILFEDLSTWGSGMVLDDGLFLACDSTVREEIVKRQNVSSALMGGEGLFNLSLSGEGIAVLESSVPREELIEFELNNDELRIDGNMAIAWSKSLQFTVERSSKSLMGSWVSGEGCVNVYRGTGKVLMAPVMPGTTMSKSNSHDETEKSSSGGVVGSVANSLFNL